MIPNRAAISNCLFYGYGSFKMVITLLVP